jgi:hypothetical protein
MPARVHDPATSARKGTVAFFVAYNAWYRFDGQSWELLAWPS